MDVLLLAEPNSVLWGSSFSFQTNWLEEGSMTKVNLELKATSNNLKTRRPFSVSGKNAIFGKPMT